MLLNYLKVFLRLFASNRTFTIINLLGLSTGIACFVLIRLYVINETSYDRHLPDAGKMYRLGMKGDMSGFSFEAAVMGGPFGQAIRDDIPEVLTSTTFYKMPRPVLLSRGENKFYEDNILFTDSVFLDFFGHRIIHGDPESMLDAPHSMVLTLSGAHKYFGDENPIGKVIRWNMQEDYTITGVIEDPVHNTHLDIDILATFNTLLEKDVYKGLLTTFYAFVTYNYVKLDKSADPVKTEEKIAGVVEKNMGEGMKESGSHFEIFLQPVTDIHLNSELVHELKPNGSRSSVLIFSAISLLILLIACLNFINLTTARSSCRTREIGVRKVVGADTDRLFIQFMLEAVFFSMICIALAGVMIGLLRETFSNFTGIRSMVPGISSAEFIIFLLLLGAAIGFLSGIYPSFYLSRSKSLWMVKGSAMKRPGRKIFRNALVVIQLGITLFLIFNTIIIYKQLQLVSLSDIGINKDELLIIPMRSSSMYSQYDVLKNEMISVPGVKDVTASSAYLGSFEQRRGFSVEGFDRQDQWMLHYISVEPNYLEVMETDIIMGRNFRTGSVADSNALMINTAMMKQAGWDQPIGKKITRSDGGIEHEFSVVGVVDDFNYASVHNQVESLLIFNNVQGCRYLGLRISGKESTLEEIRKKWTGLYPEYPFDYFYQDDYYDELYSEDQKMGSLFIYFTLLAVLISVLGLFGLVLFTSSQRTKEIGIRKAVGGTTSSLIGMLLKEYPILILIASLFTLPASWYFAKNWLENFAVKTEISPWIHIISVVLVLTICLGTILFQTLRTARANPVNALRYE